ncbi:CARDB domain-containing protein [Amycolatopsis regifaucium]|uniref:APHP domain-containing protein n=1 Tax=Amycolatopsis regifaucium TaxID=546365 RepID=A0A154M5J6_9PSEU|nr:CARDB domain-containing protein [Amycolatopsis regifaucium]KZB79149.1 APHP domain-containing protein [Amycolatopsis regifaucium]OKA07333.1 APHP domain-containing protein [Amycolatopsis regifaucium]SFH14108.1 F5/8 type C domain-containing protein [Amycolatopsis regifaucium]
MTRMRLSRLITGFLVTGLSVAGLSLASAASGPPPDPAAPPGPAAFAEVPLTRTVSASSALPGYPVANAVDGNQDSYWESANNVFPQWIQADLGAVKSLSRIVLKLPSAWESRTQTLTVRGSTDGTAFTDLRSAAGYAFTLGANTVTIPMTVSARYVRLQVTANTRWPAAQLSEFELYGPDTGDTQAPSAPANLALTEPAVGQIRLTWTASADNVGVIGYTVYRDGTPVGTLTGTVFTEARPTGTRVEYFVRAKDAAGNESVDSNHVVRSGTTAGANLAAGKPIEATSTVHSFVAANANDNNTATYWESAAGYPNSLTVKLGIDADVDSVVVKLNPDLIWAARTQDFEILGRAQGATAFTILSARAERRFDPATNQNTITIPVSGRASDVRLRFFANSGAPGGQVAEFQVIGTPAPNPDLVVTGTTWTPENPTETSRLAVSAMVKNNGTANAGATTVNVSLSGAVVGDAAVGALAPGGSTTVTVHAGTRPQGTYTVAATVDPADKVAEQNDTNNTFTSPAPLVIAQSPGPDLEVTGITSNPPNPAAGAAVSFTVAVHNRGTSEAGSSVTRLVAGETTLTGATGAIAPGATANVAISGTWTAANGGATLTATADATGTVTETNEANNGLSRGIVVGRGAAVPYVEYEAESARYQGELLEADRLRTFGHTNFATESSGRKSVRLASQGQYVEFTSANQANSIVVRNSIPDAPGGGGQDATLSLYVNGTFAQKLTLSSKHSWLYGSTDDPEGLTNTPQADARRLFDESHALLSQSYPPGTKFKLQRDNGDNAAFYIVDFVDLEQVAPASEKPANCVSITEYGAVPNDGNDDSAAIQRAVTDDQNGVIGCVWIPAGQWRQEKKILTDDPNVPNGGGQYNQIGISNVTIRGAGMWHSQLYSQIEPQNAGGINHPHEGNFGFDIDKNTQISDIAIFGSGRIRGGDGGAEGGVGLNGRFGTGTKISNVWIEHANVAVWVGRDYGNIPALWGPGDGLEFSGMRIRDTYADGINFTNGTRNSKVFNSSFRTTGDDSLAVWANQYVKDPAQDIAHDNAFTNNTIQLPWRANGIAIYGGYGNKIENNVVHDTMNYPGIMLATDHDPLPFSGQTLIANNALYRCGGVFWGEQQKFGAITFFAQGKDIPGVTLRDTEIHDSTYDGVQFKTGGGVVTAAVGGVKIDKSNNGAGVLAMSGARGSATLTNVTITNSFTGDIVREPGSQFVIDGGPVPAVVSTSRRGTR